MVNIHHYQNIVKTKETGNCCAESQAGYSFYKITILAFIFSFFTVNLHAQEKVQTYRTEYDGKVSVFAKNPNHYPVTVFADIEVINLENPPAEIGPVLIRPNSAARITSLLILNKSLPRAARVVLRTGYGNPFARHSPEAIYLLPSGIHTKAVISQGTGNQKTHNRREHHAVDFEMEEGSPVYAARGGKVALVQEISENGGISKLYNEDANFIMILHDDDTLAIYAHLMKKGSAVEPGDRVEAGQLIGYSGNTGQSHSPHLHFMVIIPSLEGSYKTVETPFATGVGILSVLKAGSHYFPAENQ